MRVPRIGLALLSSAALHCGAGPDVPETSASPITELPATPVLDQGETGSCWLYATAAWAETLHASAARASGRDAPTLQLSPAYWVYWTWLSEIAGADEPALRYGGSWGEAVELILRHGLVELGAFVRDDAIDVASAKRLLEESLRTGDLRTRAARSDRRRVRAALDGAFAVTTEMRDEMTRLFGERLDRTLAPASVRGESRLVRGADEVPVLLPRPGQAPVAGTLADAIGERDPARNVAGHRVGPLAWTWAAPPEPSDAAETRAYQKRVQRALHAGAPLPITWLYVRPAYEQGAMRAIPRGPIATRDTEWHVTLAVDYEADVPGYGRLPAGVVATPAQMEAALADDASVVFLRVKNSWGRVPGAGPPGYTDLYRPYLEGEALLCEGERCRAQRPLLGGLTLPAGF